jgi:phage tail sheath protein FI
MPNYVSPGVYTIEKDISDYAPSINTSIVGIVGFASKGPTNKATLITDQNKLIRTFGEPSEDIVGQALEGGLEILETTNSLYFVRAANESAADASATMPLGSCPALIVSGPDAGVDVANCFGGTGTGASALTLRIQVTDNEGAAQFTDNGGAGKDFVVPVGTAPSQAAALRSIIGGALDADKVGVFDDDAVGTSNLGLSGAIVGSFAGSGATLSVSSCSGTTFDPAKGADALRQVYSPSAGSAGFGASGDLVSAIKVFGSTFMTSEETAATGCSYDIESLFPGTGYNGGVKTNGDTSGNTITINGLGSQNFSVVVNQDGVAEETFKGSFVGSGVFLEDVINTGQDNPTSELIKGNLTKGGSDATAARLVRFIDTAETLFGSGLFKVRTKAIVGGGITGEVEYAPLTDAGGRFVKLVQSAATNLAGGTNGDDSDQTTSLIGDATEDPKTGMQALDDPILNIGIALVPGVYTQAVQNALITLAETTQNFLALVAPPLAIGTVQNAIDWSNGKSSSTAGSRTAAINSSYAAIYWPHVKIFSTFDGKDRFLDPTIFAARQMAYTDAVADSWFAPAGFRRGRLTKPSETEVKLNQGDRDSLYSGGNVINPIVNFPQQGITIFGQRTTQRNPTALDRINVRRLMIYIRKIILLSTQRFVFEPNDEFTWAQIEGVLNPFLDDIRRRRGITEFRVVCDETVNTPIRVDRNELWTKVLVKPTKTAEILIFEINLTNQSAQLGNL